MHVQQPCFGLLLQLSLPLLLLLLSLCALCCCCCVAFFSSVPFPFYLSSPRSLLSLLLMRVFLLPVDIQHNRCPSRFFNPREILLYKVLWSQNYASHTRDTTTTPATPEILLLRQPRHGTKARNSEWGSHAADPPPPSPRFGPSFLS